MVVKGVLGRKCMFDWTYTVEDCSLKSGLHTYVEWPHGHAKKVAQIMEKGMLFVVIRIAIQNPF